MFEKKTVPGISISSMLESELSAESLSGSGFGCRCWDGMTGAVAFAFGGSKMMILGVLFDLDGSSCLSSVFSSSESWLSKMAEKKSNGGRSCCS